MPTCERCDEWYPPSEGYVECPFCGGALRSGDARRRLEARAAALGVSAEALQAVRRAEQEARDEQTVIDDARRGMRARLESKAAAVGLSVYDYEQREEERKRDEWRQDHWTTYGDPGGLGQVTCGLAILVPILTIILGAVLSVAFLLLGRSPGAAIEGVLSGLGVAVFLVLVAIGLGARFDRLAPRSPLVRRYGEDVFIVLVLVIVLLPLVVTVAVALLT